MGQTSSGQAHLDTTQGRNVVLQPEWMKRLEDSKSLADISIPGTHNTMSHHGGPLVQCQTWPLYVQLRSGIRFIDIRCRHYKDDLPIHHEISYQHATFRQVLGIVQEFLRENPSETVIMRVRKEYRSSGNSEEFWMTMKKQLEDYQDMILWNNRSIPTLGEARGKLILLQCYKGPLIGIPYHGPMVDIADMWDVKTLFQIETKWWHVRGHMIKACDHKDNILYLTYTSACDAGAYPYTIANSMNKKVVQFLKEHPNGRYGVFAFDLPGQELIKLIIDSNT